MSDPGKPFDASFGSGDRYTAPQGDDATTYVVVNDVLCPGVILGRNGPRAQVRFTMNGSTYVRWFDTADLHAEPPVSS